MYGAHNSGRIVAQRGTFMVWGNDPQSLETLAAAEGSTLWRIQVDGDRELLAQQLRHLGFSETMVFPELPALSAELSRTEGWSFERACTSFFTSFSHRSPGAISNSSLTRCFRSPQPNKTVSPSSCFFASLVNFFFAFAFVHRSPRLVLASLLRMNPHKNSFRRPVSGRDKSKWWSNRP